MKDRIKEVRKYAELSQTKFAEKLKISRSAMSKLESGENTPSEQTTSLICKEFNVREEWLRTGNGEMYNEKDGTFTGLLAELEETDDEFIKSLITVYMGLDEDSKQALRKIADGMAEKYKKQD